MKVGELQIRKNITPIAPQKQGLLQRTGKDDAHKNQRLDFADVLAKTSHEKQELKFSAHALRRIDQRNITLSPAEMERLAEGVLKAEAKGAQSSLVLVDDMAYIVSVKNRTVVTALDRDATQGNVFTNIDSVAIV